MTKKLITIGEFTFGEDTKGTHRYPGLSRSGRKMTQYIDKEDFADLDKTPKKIRVLVQVLDDDE